MSTDMPGKDYLDYVKGDRKTPNINVGGTILRGWASGLNKKKTIS